MNHYISTTDYRNNYLEGMINSLENSISRAKYYKQTGDIRFLNESSEWIIVANLYIKEILKNHTENSIESCCNL